MCVLCVCAFVRPAAAWKTRRSSSKYIGQSIFCFGRADLAWVVNLNLNSESESLRFEACWLVTRPLLHQAGSRVRTPGLDNLKWDWHASQGCLQTPDPSSKNVGCGAAGASRLMMNSSCSFGGIPDLGSWVLDGLYVSCKRLLIRAVRQRLLFFFPRPSPLSRCPDRRQARWHAPDHLTLLVYLGVSGAARLR